MLPDHGTDDWRARPAGRLPGSTSGTPCGSPRGWWPAVESGASRPALDRTGCPSDGPSSCGGGAVQAFLIDLENKPGAFADVAEMIAAKGINITAVSGATCGD